jgi:glycylpeptide N-tetradecanoyltransferase
VDKVHVVAVDYRGFGYSTGSPDEKGLIIDGIATVKWALDVAKIPPERIVLLGQSLGTAVATAVAEHFVVKEGLEFRGLVLVAGFSDLPTLLMTYAVGGVIPILSPLRPYPRLQQFFAERIQETWFSATRLANLVRKSKNINLRIVHSQNDFEILWTHSDTLFSAAANATSTGEQGLTQKQIDSLKVHQDLGESGFSNLWMTVQEDGGRKLIRQDVVRYGGKPMLTVVF